MMPREGGQFVVPTFLQNLEQYIQGTYLDSRYAKDRHTGRAASFLAKLKEDKVETCKQLGGAIEEQLGLWCYKNPYLDKVKQIDSKVETSDFYVGKAPKKHAQSFDKKDYANYFHLLADAIPAIKLDFFVQLYTAQMKGDIKLDQVDVEALCAYTCSPAQAREFESAFQTRLIESKQMQEAAERNRQLFSSKMVPLLLANLIAPTGVFKVEPQNARERGWEHAKHHLPFLILGLSTALVLALKGGGLGLLVAAAGYTIKEVVSGVHLFDECIHMLKGVLHGSELIGHDHLPSLWSFTKFVLRVEADTKQQIEYFNASVSRSMKDPAEMFRFSRYLLDNLEKVLPLSNLHFVQDSHHTHIEDIRILVAFFLCISCLSFGYLPQDKHEIKTDENFLNKIMFVVTYLGPSVEDIRNYLKDYSSAEVRPTLRRGYMKAHYVNDAREDVIIRWRWNPGMKVEVKPYNRKNSVTLLFDAEDKSAVEHDAMPFEIALLNSILNDEDPGDSINLETLPGVSFSEAKVPQILDEDGASITDDVAALHELKAHIDDLIGITDYKEYKTTQDRLKGLERTVGPLVVQSARNTTEIAEQKKGLHQLAGPKGRVEMIEEAIAQTARENRDELRQVTQDVNERFQPLEEGLDDLKKGGKELQEAHVKLSDEVETLRAQCAAVLNENKALQEENKALQKTIRQVMKTEPKPLGQQPAPLPKPRRQRSESVMFPGFKRGFLLNLPKSKVVEIAGEDEPRMQAAP